MEESWGKLDAEAATNLTEMMSMKRQGRNSEDAANRLVFTRQRLLPFAGPTDNQAAAHIQVGSYYEIDHSVLHEPTIPNQLKPTRVIMVSKKSEFTVSLRFPSLYSLRAHFRDENRGTPGKKILPSLDEQYVMGSELAGEALYRRIPPHEIAVQRNQWSFWVVPSIREPCIRMPSSPNQANNFISSSCNVNLVANKKGSILSELKSTGMIRWGKRRQVRFLRRHVEPQRKLQITSPPRNFEDEENEQSDNDDDDDDQEQEDEEEEEKVLIKSGKEEMESMSDGQSIDQKARNPQKRKNYPRRCSSRVHKFKKVKREKQNQVIPFKQRKKKAAKKHISRWTAERYKLAEKNILRILKEKGAVSEKPILRPVLRAEARRLIGDTGLLDHLLKHMAGKVAPGGEERFRRRHNADGAMEYWLESADLLNIRKEAGVQDPYWIPPPGWKLGDHPTQDPICARELKDLREEMTKMKKEIQELRTKKQEENPVSVTTLGSSLVSEITEQHDPILLPLKGRYIDLMNKKAKIEKQLMEISQSLCEMEGDMVKLAAEQQNKLVKFIDVEKEKDAQSVEEQKASQSGDPTTVTDDKAAKRERLKSGFRICKPQGSFLWPNMTLSPQVVAADDGFPVVLTPPSVSSAPPPAERQLVTLSSSPKSFKATPPDTTITPSKTTIINLNEIPAGNNNNTGFRGSSILSSHSTTPAVTYQRRHYYQTTTTSQLAPAEKEDEKGSSASSPCKSVGGAEESWLALTALP